MTEASVTLWRQQVVTRSHRTASKVHMCSFSKREQTAAGGRFHNKATKCHQPEATVCMGRECDLLAISEFLLLSMGGLDNLMVHSRGPPSPANPKSNMTVQQGSFFAHSTSSWVSVRWPLLCRRMFTSFPADRRLQRELLVELARLVYLVEPLVSSSHPDQGAQSLRASPTSAATSSGPNLGGSQPSISSAFLDWLFCFKTKLSQNPDFFSNFNSSFNRKLAL